MFNTTNALVLREVRYKEADRMLTLLTASDGRITAKARGALRKSSRTAAATQQLTYSELTLFQNRGKWTVNEGTVIESFDGLRCDIAALALGCYIAQCVEAVSVEEQSDGPLLQLALNSLYALSRALYPPERIKAAFEMRLMCIEGYAPELDGCCVCSLEEPEEPLLLGEGSICCRGCAGSLEGERWPLCRESLKALRYIAEAPPKQLFAFEVERAAQRRLSAAAEGYLLTKTERSFGTLEYWKKVR